MRHSGSPSAIAAFTLPPHPPPEVAEAKAEFDSIAARWASVKGELQDAVEAHAGAREADLQAIVKYAEQGKDVADPQAKQRKVEALITDLRFRLKGLDVAVDQAGNRLAEAVTEHRARWLPLLDAAEADAAERYNHAITQARAALDDLRPARGAVDWLDRFDVDLARSGRQVQFAGGRLRVRSRSGLLKGEFDPTDLLALAGRITTEPDAPRQTVTIPAPRKVASRV